MAANGTKVYNIKINGLDESVKVVDALITKLDTLQQRLEKISSMGVKLNSGGGGGGATLQELSAEDKLFNSIYNTETKIEEARNQNYQYLVKIKDELKQVTVEQKAAAAAAKLNDNQYNLETVAGMKEKLKDLKALLQTTPTGTDLFSQLTREANELTNKLRLIESSYGQFGRNVGNYSSALGGLSAVTVMVGETEVKFKNVDTALREMKRQLKNLRDDGKMATDQYKQLNEAFKELERRSQGMSSNMSSMLNMMTSVGAIASISGGLSALFGSKNNDIQKTIQQLLALQTVMQGLNTLRKQMVEEKGIGAALTAADQAIDNFVAKITGAKVAEEGLTMATNGATKAVRVFSTVLKGLGIGAIIVAIAALANAVQKAAKEIADGVSRSEAFNASLDRTTKALERRIDLLKGDYIKGTIDDEEFLNQQLKAQNDYLKDNIQLLEQASKSTFWSKIAGRYATRGINVENPTKGAKTLGWLYNEDIKTIEQAKEIYDKTTADIKKGTGFWDSLFGKTEKNQVAAANVLLSDFVKRVNEINPAAEDAQEQIKALYDEMTNDARMKDIFTNLSKSLPREEAVKILQAINAELEKMGKAADTAASAMQGKIKQWGIDSIVDDIQRQLAAEELQYKQDLMEYGQNAEAKEALEKAHQKRLNDIYKQAGQRRLQDEYEIQRRLIAAMKDGLNKTLKEIELERKQAQDQAIQSQRMVEEKLAAIDAEYNKKVLDAKKEWKEQMVDIYNDLWSEIYQNQMDIDSMTNEAAMSRIENLYNQALRKIDAANAQSPFVRGYNPDYENVSERVKDMFRDQFRSDSRYYEAPKEILKTAVEYRNLIDKVEEEKKEFIKEYGEAVFEQLEYFNSAETMALEKLENSEFFKKNKEAILEAVDLSRIISTDAENETITKQFDNTMEVLVKYNDLRLDETRKYYSEKADLEKEQAQKEYEFNRQEELRNFEFLMDEYKKKRKVELDGLVDDENYEANRKAIVDKYNQLIDASTQQHYDKLEALEKSKNENITSINEQYYTQIQKETYDNMRLMIREYEIFASKLSQLQSNLTIYDSAGWGIVDISATKKRNDEIIKGAQSLAGRIIHEKEALKEQLDKNEITFADWKTANDRLDELQEQVIKTADTAVKTGKNIIGDFISSINTYVQALGSGLQDVLGWLRDKEDAEYNHRKEMLQKQTEELEEALNKQQDITEKYADNVNSIEEELSDARGDRRQQLIDMLNQQKAAQRASLNEEKRIEKEKEAMEAKQEQMELEQKKRERKRQIADAIISSALAVVNGLATKPFVPVGIAMGALAAALGAAQVAIIKSTKYANGGLLEGKSHAQGGVKVLGGRAELEGGEFITNKQTTAKNIDLLDFINTKKKRVELGDLVEFYSGGKLKSSLQKNMPKNKFADGGQLPTLRSDISLNNRFINALEQYADRPSYVSVVEIMDAEKEVNNVRTIAGLD